MAHQTPGGVTARVTQLALERLRAIRHSDEAIPAEDLTDDPVAVVLRYFDQANRDDWVLVDGADKHLDGDEDGEREIRAIVEALAPGNDTLQQVIDLVSTAPPVTSARCASPTARCASGSPSTSAAGRERTGRPT
ncbi:hypothetical protein ACFQV2_28570 [Actinokineospora soli]|uniref:Uncharacterized protein n=1 Tax=Actinokineospora soli TaxID=1048753 RepID=A0ABW2TU10_9PSEU